MSIWDTFFGGDKKAPASMSDLVTGDYAHAKEDFGDVSGGSGSSASRPLVPETGMPKDSASLGGARAMSRGMAEGVGSVFDVAANFAEAKSSPKDLWDRARGKEYDERGLGVADALRAAASGARDYAKTLATDLEVEHHGIAETVGRAVPETVALMGTMTAGPAGPIIYEAARTPEEPIRGALRGLAYTAAPLKAAGGLTAAIPNQLARAGIRGGIAGTTTYYLSDDPVAGLSTGLAGALGAGAPRVAATPASVPRGTPQLSGAGQAVEAMRPATEGRVFSIGLDKFNGYNLRQTVREAAQRAEAANPGHANPQTHAATLERAASIKPLIDASMSLDDIARLGPGGRSLNAEQAVALGQTVAEVGEKVDVLKAAVRANPGDTEAMGQLIRETALLDRYIDLHGNASQAQGRGLNAYKISLGSGADALRTARSMLPAGATPEEVARRMVELPDAASQTVFWRSLMKLGRGAKVTSDALHTLWMNGLLSGPPTHVMNVQSAAIFQTYEGIAEQTGQAALGAVRSGARQLVGKGPAPERVYFREIPARMRAWAQSWSEAGEVGRQGFLTGDLPEFLGGRGGAKLEHQPPGLLDNPILSAPSRALTAEDAAAKLVAFRGELGARAAREGIRRGLKGEALRSFEAEYKLNPPADALRSASGKADYVTFTDDLGETGEKFRALAKTTGGKWVVPFMRTLVNIQKRGIERGPMAVATPTFWRKMGEGGIARDEAIVRALPGTALTLGFGSYLGSLIDQGRVTGAVPDDPAERTAFYEEGKTPYSALVDLPGGKRWINYGRMEPFGSTIGMFVDGIRAYQKSTVEDEPAFESAVEGAVSTLRENMLSKTGFLGALDFTNMLDDPSRYAMPWVNRMAGSVVPAAVRQLARNQDPAVRVAETPLEAIQAGIPGQREQLVQRMGAVTGEPQAFGEPAGGNLVSPMWASEPNERPIFGILEATGTKVGPPSKTLNIEVGKKSPARKALRELRESGRLSERGLAKVDAMLGTGLSVRLDTEDYERMVGITGDVAAERVERAGDILTSVPRDQAQDWILDQYEKVHKAGKDSLRAKYIERVLDEIAAEARP